MQSKLFQAVTQDPFRLFFPFGLIFAIYALNDWIWFGFGLSTFYPGQSHADLMFVGFLMSFIFGFLMTAIPRFTGTNFASRWEIFVGLGIISATAIAAALASRRFLMLTAVCAILSLIRFAAVRFVQRKTNPPYSFVFVGVGLGMGLLGFGLMMGLEWGIAAPAPIALLARTLAYQGMGLSLVLGVGSRLIPGILGWSEVVQEQRSVYENRDGFFAIIPRSMKWAVVIFIASFVIESFAFPQGGKIIRTAVTAWIGLSHWRLHLRPKTKTPFTWMVWSSAWMIVMGMVANAVFMGEWAIAGLHLIFVGGFVLLTILIAGRVILAHGTEGMKMENARMPYWLIAGLILLAALTRWLAPIAPNSYLRHLGYAAGCLIAGLIIWGFYFIPRAWRSTKNP